MRTRNAYTRRALHVRFCLFAYCARFWRNRRATSSARHGRPHITCQSAHDAARASPDVFGPRSVFHAVDVATWDDMVRAAATLRTQPRVQCRGIVHKRVTCTHRVTKLALMFQADHANVVGGFKQRCDEQFYARGWHSDKLRYLHVIFMSRSKI